VLGTPAFNYNGFCQVFCISCCASEREARANSELAHMRADKQRLESLLQVNPAPQHLNPKPLNPDPQTLNPKPLNPKP
jgi:hypothetical protein